MTREADFVAADLDLLVDVLRVNDAMENAARSVKLIEKLVPYPIRSLVDLERVFASPPAKAGSIRLGRHTVTLADASRFLGAEGTFPIEDREQLISRVIASFEAWRLQEFAATQERQADFEGPVQNG